MSEVAVITVPAQEWSEAMAMIKDTRDQVAKLTAKDQKEYLTIPEVRDLLSLSKTTTERYINDGVIPIARLNNKERSKRYVKRSDLDTLIASGKL